MKHPLPTENIPTKYNLDIYSLEEHKQMGFVKCDGCDIYFLGKRRQMKHFYVVHRDLMPTPTCPICCKEFMSCKCLLKVHIINIFAKMFHLQTLFFITNAISS